MEIEVCWQSRLAIAVNKPPSLPTQSPAGIESLETVLLGQLGRKPGELWFPHRIDRLVSGVILVALSKRSARLLSDQFATRKTEKTYEAIVRGRIDAPLPPPIIWEDYIRKVPERSLAEACLPSSPGAKQAVTSVTVLAYDDVLDRTRLRLCPETGRMHQLRIQNALRGHPIVGDRLYGAPPITSDLTERDKSEAHPPESDPSEVGKRILLHARKLGFHDPETGKRTFVETKCPF